MSIATAVSLAPSFVPAPAWWRQSLVPISTRFPRDGVSAAFPASGTSGRAGTIVPLRTDLEVAQWGADINVWVYINRPQGAALSGAAFVASMTAIGVPVVGVQNHAAISDSVGPFAKSLSGGEFKAASTEDRPLLVSGLPQVPTAARVPISVSVHPTSDAVGTIGPKIAADLADVAAGCVSMHIDDPRSTATFCGSPSITPSWDMVGQGADFSATAVAGFSAWLMANTTDTERSAVGLTGWSGASDIVAWLRSNHPTAVYSNPPSLQVNATAIDTYIFRTTVSNVPALRTIFVKWFARYLRDAETEYQQTRKAALGVPVSCNFWQATPMEYVNWIARRGLWDFVMSETEPPAWSEFGGAAVGSDAFNSARMWQQARQQMNASVCDSLGLRCLFEHKPTAPNTAPARVVKQVMRQSIMQTVADGHVPVIPIEVYLTVNSTPDQGTDVDGYRWWGSPADYKDCFDFIRASSSLVDGYEKLAQVILVAHHDSFPFKDGTGASRFSTLLLRLGELYKRDVAYHWSMVGDPDNLLPATPSRLTETTAPMQIRIQDDNDYSTMLGRLALGRSVPWSLRAADAAGGFSPVRSTSPYVRATARYNASAGRVSVHLHNYALNADGTPAPQTTTMLWNWGGAGVATVTRLGESAGTVDLSRGSAQITLTEYAIVNFAVTL